MNYSYKHGLSNSLLNFIDVYKTPHLIEENQNLISDNDENNNQFIKYEFRQSPCCVLVSSIPIPLPLSTSKLIRNKN